MRKSGILMPVSSLPSKEGIGDFGENAKRFVDLISSMGFKVWQILPLNPLGFGNSPYQPYSSYAMDECYISLEKLYDEGLLSSFSYYEEGSQVEYEKVRKYKLPYLKEAYQNFVIQEDYKKFSEIFWVKRYSVFSALKKRNNLKEWSCWDKSEQDWSLDLLKDEKLKEEAEFETFIQYVLKKQWNDLKLYANEKGIEMMGDLPFYVGYDSEEVWSSKKNFLLDEKFHPSFIAGVPPDYFSETGQRWGNPIYDWDYLEKTDFDFWINRLKYNSEIFDILRIDHFRAFDTYWKIPGSCPTAKEGQWIEAPGYAFFDALFEKLPELHLVAEDLGELRQEVLDLRDAYHFSGMKVIQFAFEGFDQTFDDRENMIIYTGTHDNETLVGWVKNMSEEEKKKMTDFFKKKGIRNKKINHSFISYCLSSIADLAVIPMWDILGLDNEARMNVPGTIGGSNWKWRMTDFEAFKKEKNFLKGLNEKTKRV